MLGHDELDIEERIAAPVTLDAFEDFIDWHQIRDYELSPGSLPLLLGWDMRRQFGEAGFPVWRDLMHSIEPPLLAENLLGPGDPRTPCTMREYDAALIDNWAAFARPHHWTDCLIVDQMAAAQREGWEPCAGDEVNAAIEAVLDDLARRSGAKRAVIQAEIDALDAAEMAEIRAEQDAEFAVYQAWLAVGEPATDPLANEHRARKQRIAQYYATAPREPSPIPAEILDIHKRQSEHLAATMLGPLPDHPELPIDQAVSLARFYAHLPSGKIIYTPTRDLWTSASADKHVGRVKDAFNANGPGQLASTFLSQFRCVQSMGWDPSEPMIIEDRVLTQEGWITSKGDKTFNRYIPSEIRPIEGDVSPWLNHAHQVFPNEAAHMIKWLAHRVQRPGDKVNHALVLIGTEGIGKDTILEPVISAIGRTNFASVSAKHFFESDFNGYLKSVMLRIDEVHDLGGESKYAFHDRTKPIIAAPPSAHMINEKFTPHYVAKNVCGVILTSNHLDALYLSPNDRRHFVCVSEARKEQFGPDYFEALHAWFDNGGAAKVAHYLANLDLTGFNAKAPPPQTSGWKTLVNAGLAPEAGDMADVIEALGKPAALTLTMIRNKATSDSSLRAMFEDPKQRTKIPRRLADCGYTTVMNPDTGDGRGRWRTSKGRINIYGRQELGENERLTAARALSMSDLLPSHLAPGQPPPY